MVAAYTSKMSINLDLSTWCHIYEDTNLHRHFNKDIKSGKIQNAITRFLYKDVFQIKHTCTTLYVCRCYTHGIFYFYVLSNDSSGTKGTAITNRLYIYSVCSLHSDIDNSTFNWKINMWNSEALFACSRVPVLNLFSLHNICCAFTFIFLPYYSSVHCRSSTEWMCFHFSSFITTIISKY
jgi:hypothetical protein